MKFLQLLFLASLAHLGPHPHCRAYWSIEPAARVCLDESLWHQQISHPLDLAGPLQNFEVHGPVRVSSAPQNEGQPKQLFLSWPIRQLPILYFTNPWVGAVDHLRETVSQDLRPTDRWGLLRSLILNERPPGEALAWARELGFVHVASTSGIHLLGLLAWLSGLVAWAGDRLTARQGRWLVWVMSSVLVAYVFLLSGKRLGLLRPFGVLTIRSLGQRIGVRWSSLAPLLISVGLDACVGIYCHESAQAMSGRMIYALAVAGGVMSLNDKRQSSIRSHVAMAWGSWVGVAAWSMLRGEAIAPTTPVLSWVSKAERQSVNKS